MGYSTGALLQSGAVRVLHAQGIQFIRQFPYLRLCHHTLHLSGIVTVHGIRQDKGNRDSEMLFLRPGIQLKVGLHKVAVVALLQPCPKDLQSCRQLPQLISQKAAVGVLAENPLLVGPGAPHHQPVPVITARRSTIRRKLIARNLQLYFGLLILK